MSIIQDIKTEEAKKVMTQDLSGEENGFLTELFKDGHKTVLYLTCAKPGAFKGYHLHRVRGARYICIKGTMRISLFIDGKLQNHILTSNPPMRLTIPPMVPTGLQNIGNEDGWLINYPDPAYDPDLKDEQIDFTQEELDSGAWKSKV